jgi:hypothetical protein
MSGSRFPRSREELGVLAPVPQWLIDWYDQQQNGNGQANGHANGIKVVPGEILEEGRRNSTLASMAGHMRRCGFDRDAIFEALWITNEARCDPSLNVADVEKIADSVCRYAPDPLANITIVNSKGEEGETKEADPMVRFGRPVPFLELKRDTEALWVWNGYLSRGGITLFSALWKAGKTTLLAHLLHQLESGGTFCGRDLAASKVLYVSEESQGRWAERRDALGIGNHCRLLSRPFRSKPSMPDWLDFLAYIKGLCVDWPADLIVFDTISNLWPVRDENDAACVQAALMPLHHVLEQAALLLVHHNRKGDGQEATATRGSGALPAFVDTILELRRYAASDRQDRRRVLTGYGRYDDTPPELVVELTEEGFTARGTAADVSCRELVSILLDILPDHPPGLAMKDIEESWPSKTAPAAKRLTDALHSGTETGLWQRDGEGKRGDPYRFWRSR